MKNESCRNCAYHTYPVQDDGSINREGPGCCTYLLPAWATEAEGASEEIKESLCDIPPEVDFGPECMVWRQDHEND